MSNRDDSENIELTHLGTLVSYGFKNENTPRMFSSSSLVKLILFEKQKTGKTNKNITNKHCSCHERRHLVVVGYIYIYIYIYNTHDKQALMNYVIFLNLIYGFVTKSTHKL